MLYMVPQYCIHYLLLPLPLMDQIEHSLMFSQREIFLLTCDVFFDLVDLADRVVSSEHVEVKRLGVFTNMCPCAYVRSGPP